MRQKKRNEGGGGRERRKLLFSPPPRPSTFFCSRSNFRAITRLETLATQAKSLFTFFASFAEAYHYLMKLIKWNFWILKEYNNFSSLWKFEPDIPISFGEIFFEKPQNLQRMYELINFLPLSNFAVFNCCYFLCYWLQRAETCTNSINKPAL